MVRPVVHGHLDVHHGIARQKALGHGVLHALVDGRQKAARDLAAHDLVDELVALPLVGLEAQPAIAELARAARLLLVTALGLGHLADRLAVRNAHRHKARLHARLLLEARKKRLHLGLAHGGDHRLVRLLAAGHAQGRVVLDRTRQERPQLVLVLLVDGLDGHRVLGNRQRQGVDGHVAGLRQRVAGTSVGELGHHDDVAGFRALHVGRLLAHHHVEVTEAILLARARVDQLHARLEHARDDLEEAQASHKRVGHRLEHECGRLALFVHERLLPVGQTEAPVMARMREVGADVLHKALDALLDDRGTHEHGNEQLLRDSLVEQPLQLLLRQLLLAVEVLHHQLVIGLGHEIAQLVARRARRVGVLGRNVLHALIGGSVLVEVARLHPDDVDDALEVRVHADGDGHGAQARAEARVQKRHGRVEVGVLAVDVIDEHGARQAHILGLTPELRGHDLRARHGVNHEQRHLGRLHARQRVADEVGMARRVEQVDLVVFVRDGSDGRADRELAPDLLLVVVKVGFPVVGRAHAGRAARDVQHRLGERCLAGAVLAHQHDVPYVFGSRSCHVDHQLSC